MVDIHILDLNHHKESLKYGTNIRRWTISILWHDGFYTSIDNGFF